MPRVDSPVIASLDCPLSRKRQRGPIFYFFHNLFPQSGERVGQRGVAGVSQMGALLNLMTLPGRIKELKYRRLYLDKCVQHHRRQAINILYWVWHISRCPKQINRNHDFLKQEVTVFPKFCPCQMTGIYHLSDRILNIYPFV